MTQLQRDIIQVSYQIAQAKREKNMVRVRVLQSHRAYLIQQLTALKAKERVA